ncbi:MAG: alanine:cation symporter family protein, partial [Candidatus Nealsonbacteria bacterium]|nr:alanine:cation symporter family protein [Candidatus Nealsonbacteria bacterium]
MGGSFGGGCAFQVSQSQGAIRQQMLQEWPAYADCQQVVEVGRQPDKMRSDAIEQLNRILKRGGAKDNSLATGATGADARQRIGELSLGEDDLATTSGPIRVLELAEMDADELAQTEAQFGLGVRLLARYLGWLYGAVMAVLVGLVIIGGIRRIAATAEKIVPLMCVIYVLTALCILAVNYDRIGWAFAVIFSEAFQWQSIYGGVLGVLVVGIQRAAFSNEAGIGSAAIAHAAAKTEEPIREGIVASLGPFIDTVVICTMTGLVIVITGVYDNPAFAEMVAAKDGAALTTKAFGSVVSWFPWILCTAVVLFAYSTMISWSYYG